MRGTVRAAARHRQDRCASLVFAKGEKEREAQEAGADVVGGEDLVKKIQDESWLDFDSAIATPDMMGLVGRLGKVLGPRGLMPNPKVGHRHLRRRARRCSEVKAGKVEYRVEKAGIVHVPIGKASFGAEKLLDNANARCSPAWCAPSPRRPRATTSSACR